VSQDHHDDPLHFHHLVVEMGFAAAEDVDEAADVQAELAEHGIAAHLSDLLIDGGVITEAQRDKVLLQQDMMRVLTGLGGTTAGPAEPPVSAAWVVAALTPVAIIDTTIGVIAAAVAVAIGAVIAGTSPYRWHALGWLTSIVSPTAPLAAVAAPGAMHRRRMHVAIAAIAIAATSVLVALDVSITPGLLLVAGGLALATTRIGSKP
jgi:hypothetical protein